IVVRPDAASVGALGIMLKNSIRHLPVVLANKLVGIVSNRDFHKAMPMYDGTQGFVQQLEETPVDSIMTKNPQTIGSDSDLLEAAWLMINQRYSALPVVDFGFLVGILTSHDVIRALAHESWDVRKVETPKEEGS
ncbi:MAG: CBS domain-containing protein, partial [Planctomycetota bacterium]